MKAVAKDEVFAALSSMKPFKASSMDGFQPFFFKTYWDVVGEDIWRLIQTAFEQGNSSRKILETFMVLIPKQENHSNFKQFRPISLCNVIYKQFRPRLPTGTIKLIMFCVQFFSVSLLWNGLKLPVFSPTRELRQGDPLSPYLFVLCMEKLACLINKKVYDKTWLPICLQGRPSISHLLFADDVLLFTKATKAQMRILVSVSNGEL